MEKFTIDAIIGKHMRYDHFVQKKPYGEDSIYIYRSEGEKKSDLPIFVIHAGHSRWKSSGKFYRRRSHLFAVEYIDRGDCLLRQDNKEILISEGDFFLLQRDKEHSYKTGPSGILEKSYVALDGLSLDSILSALDLQNIDSLSIPEAKSAAATLDKLIEALAEKGEVSAQEISTKAYRFLLALKPPGESGMPPLIRDLINFMYKHLDRSLSVAELAEFSGISPPHLNRLFKRYTKQSPISFFHQQKMHWVADLLVSTSLSIKEIAYRGGFENPLYFSSRFSNYFKESPSDYRKKHKIFFHPDKEEEQ